MEAITNFFTKMTKQNQLLLAFAVLVIVCTLYRDCWLCRYIPKLDGFKMMKEKFEVASSDEETEQEEIKEDFENEDESSDDVEPIKGTENFEDSSEKSLVLFYAPWCPHCKSMMGDWNRLRKRSMDGLRVVKVNCDEKPRLAEKYNVKGFPTIILFKNGKRVHFEGPRNYDNFVKFLGEN